MHFPDPLPVANIFAPAITVNKIANPSTRTCKYFFIVEGFGPYPAEGQAGNTFFVQNFVGS